MGSATVADGPPRLKLTPAEVNPHGRFDPTEAAPLRSLHDHDAASVVTRLHSLFDLAVMLSWREFVVRYKRSILGVGWALADPVLHVAIYLLVFSVILDADRGVANYPMFTLLGVLAWLFFSMTLDHASGVLLEHAALIRKLAFPTELLVGSVVLSRLSSLLAGLALALVTAGAMSAFTATSIAWHRAPWLLLGIVLLVALTAGLALIVGSLGVIFGDAQFLVRFVLRIGFFACPIVYPMARVPEAARAFFELNPLVGILWCFQTLADSGAAPPSSAGWLASTLGSFASLACGLFLFRRLRGHVAELV